MPSCVLRYCKNQSGKTNKSDGITFHKVPRPGQETREKWIKFVQKNRSEETWLPSDYTVICSAHFKNEDKVLTTSGITRLKNTAVPWEDPITPEKPLNETEGDDSLSMVSVSSSDSIFDSPKMIVVKKKLHKEYAAKTVLAERMNKLKRQNIYLKKKCQSYKNIIRRLKSKNTALMLALRK